MTPRPRTARRDQVNIAVEADTALVLKLIAARDDTSVPELVRAEVDRLVKRRLKDPGLAAAVAAIRESQTAERDRAARRSGGAEIHPLKQDRGTGQRAPSEDADRPSAGRRSSRP